MMEQERAAGAAALELSDLKTELRTSEMGRQDLQVLGGTGRGVM